MATEFLIPQEKYLEAGAHIGTKTQTGGMRPFIYKRRDDGLHVLDLKKLDERMKLAADFISRYDPKKLYVVGSKDNSVRAVKKFCEVVGCNGIAGRFTPGRFTNPARTDFVEPGIVLVVDPGVDRQSVREAFELNIPVVAFCDTNNTVRGVDLVVPTNNKGRKAIALLFWILARELLKKRGAISVNEEYQYKVEDFEA
ncbi:MAG TPA: 30S ribosomal protein S2 [Candidatus Norongarragalinales archaeon]|jgi:small subunit ribosomal protein S2|nr:30S ribosomal protein S2 [Candidatus Norongarragalinales archaeon]